jgi:hypothetical protein
MKKEYITPTTKTHHIGIRVLGQDVSVQVPIGGVVYGVGGNTGMGYGGGYGGGDGAHSRSSSIWDDEEED